MDRRSVETPLIDLFEILAQENAPVMAYSYEINSSNMAYARTEEGLGLIEYLAQKNAPAAFAVIHDIDFFVSRNSETGLLLGLQTAQHAGSDAAFVALMAQTKEPLKYARDLIGCDNWRMENLSDEVFGAVVKPFIAEGALSQDDYSKVQKFISKAELDSFVDEEAISVARQVVMVARPRSSAPKLSV